MFGRFPEYLIEYVFLFSRRVGERGAERRRHAFQPRPAGAASGYGTGQMDSCRLVDNVSGQFETFSKGLDKLVRLAIVVEILVRIDGSIADSDVYRAVVTNKAKLAYNSVAAWLDGTEPEHPHAAAVKGMDEQLRVQDRVAQQLRKLRFEHGALTLETLEARAVFDAGTLSDLVPEGRNRAKDLIEAFMIAANGVSARFLDQ